MLEGEGLARLNRERQGLGQSRERGRDLFLREERNIERDQLPNRGRMLSLRTYLDRSWKLLQFDCFQGCLGGLEELDESFRARVPFSRTGQQGQPGLDEICLELLGIFARCVLAVSNRFHQVQSFPRFDLGLFSFRSRSKSD